MAIRRCTGYCKQMDIHSEGTGPELRSTTQVLEWLDLLDMHDIADHFSSADQMKQLTSGIELAALPSVIFLSSSWTDCARWPYDCLQPRAVD